MDARLLPTRENGVFYCLDGQIMPQNPEEFPAKKT